MPPFEPSDEDIQKAQSRLEEYRKAFKRLVAQGKVTPWPDPHDLHSWGGAPWPKGVMMTRLQIRPSALRPVLCWLQASLAFAAAHEAKLSLEACELAYNANRAVR